MPNFILSTYYGNRKSFDFLIPPLGLAMVSATLKREGHDVTIYDPNLPGNSLEGLHDLVMRKKPDILGLGLYQNGFTETLALAREIRKEAPALKIIGGGPQVTTWREDIYMAPGADAFDLFFAGETEEHIGFLSSWFEGKSKKEDIPGIIYRKGDRIFQNRPDLSHDLRHLPFPSWESFDMERYLPILPVELSRGCPWQRCSFCVHKAIASTRRERGTGRVIQEIGRNLALGVRHFRVTDSMPTEKILRNLCSTLIEKGVDITWSTFGNTRVSTKELALLMKEAGCISVFLGIESGDNGMLKHMKKGVTVRTNREGIAALREGGLKVAACNIIGFPGETEETIRKTVDFNLETRPDSVSFFPLGILPGSELAMFPEKFGISLHENWKKKFMGLRYNLMGGEVSHLHYFDYSDGKPNTYYLVKAKEIIDNISPLLFSQEQAPQLADHAFLLSDLYPEEEMRDIIGDEIQAPYEVKLTRLFQYLLEENDQGCLDVLLGRGWDRAGTAV
ncbi:MAG: B12-binding domain-containing radical SAM protein [Armatimonadetes bacterium]|nr:B12-binding domain-containing radical SAM protein [Armatimonadota bacterium]